MDIESSLALHFAALPDPRMVKKCDHQLLDIVMIALCATIANANGWEEIAEFGQSRLEWFKQWLSLPNGIPSHDTFRRVFELIDPMAFSDCFAQWVQATFSLTEGQVIAIDGKTARGTCDRTGQAQLQLVSAWATGNGLTLIQQAFVEPGNEVETMRFVLDLIEVKNQIVTLDANGCRKDIAQTICDKGGDYVLTVRGNQPNLHRLLAEAFEDADEDETHHKLMQTITTEDPGHGRFERRTCTVIANQTARELGWTGSQTFVRVVRQVQVADRVPTHETRYYISSLPSDPALLLGAIRAHWGIENSAHWVLDVIFREDAARTRTRHAAHNLAIVRRLALNLLKHDKSKGSLKLKRYRASTNEAYLAQVLSL